jgi:hypothetical protein
MKKQIFNYCSAYLSGVVISSSFVLFSNEMFYSTVIRGRSPTGEETRLLDEIYPRELFGLNARQTFLKHKIEEEKNDDTRLYHTYIQSQKSPEKKDANVYQNIYNKKDN